MDGLLARCHAVCGTPMSHNMPRDIGDTVLCTGEKIITIAEWVICWRTSQMFVFMDMFVIDWPTCVELWEEESYWFSEMCLGKYGYGLICVNVFTAWHLQVNECLENVWHLGLLDMTNYRVRVLKGIRLCYFDLKPIEFLFSHVTPHFSSW